MTIMYNMFSGLGVRAYVVPDQADQVDRVGQVDQVDKWTKWDQVEPSGTKWNQVATQPFLHLFEQVGPNEPSGPSGASGRSTI